MVLTVRAEPNPDPTLLTSFVCCCLPPPAVHLAEKSENERDYSRYDFLLHDYGYDNSILTRGNDKQHKRLKLISERADDADQEEGGFADETALWDQWKHYPNFPARWHGLDLATGGEGDAVLDFFAWLVHTFHRSILEGCYHASLRAKGFNCITLDEFVFVFLQAQHNIDKWNLLELAYQRGKIRRGVDDKELTTEERQHMKLIDSKGYEFPNGAGVSGIEGETRRRSIVKRLHDIFYDYDASAMERTKANREALLTALMALMEDEQKRAREAGRPVPGEEDEKLEKPKKKKPRKENTRDDKMDRITAKLWMAV